MSTSSERKPLLSYRRDASTLLGISTYLRQEHKRAGGYSASLFPLNFVNWRRARRAKRLEIAVDVMNDLFTELRERGELLEHTVFKEIDSGRRARRTPDNEEAQ